MSATQGRVHGYRAMVWGKMVIGTATLVLAGGVPVVVSAQQSATAPLVFDGVTVVDVEKGKLVSGQRVVVVGNRIQAVGGAGAVKSPQGAQVVDARGKYLIPGLWDMHVHGGPSPVDRTYPLFLANGVTGIRDAAGIRDTGSRGSLEQLVQWRREILAGSHVGPPRQILVGDVAFRSLANYAAARRVIDSLKAAGADMIKMLDLTPTSLFLTAASARDAGLRLGNTYQAIYAKERQGTIPTTVLSDSGVQILDRDPFTGELMSSCLYPNADVEKCQPVGKRLARNGTWWVPMWMHTFKTAVRNRARVIYANYGQFCREFWSDSLGKRTLYDYLPHGDSLAPAPPLAGVEPVYGRSPLLDSLGYMYAVKRTGVPVLMGSDGGGAALAGFSAHVEMATYVLEGLTPLQALQAATLSPAKLLRATDSLGTVARGKLADLVLLDANPLADITNTTRIRAVVANGRYFDRAALDGVLAGVQALKLPPTTGCNPEGE